MELRTVRKTLVAQHEQLRSLMLAVESSLDAKLLDAAEIGKRVVALRDAVLAHNTAEEATLGPILREVDAWGPEHVKQMLDEHQAEHRVIVEKLKSGVKPAAVREVIAHLRGHMLHEEDSILSEALLQD
jgi:hemerythrin superfamily protein